ncbi:lysophospholipase L1-like esterase [Neolewinella xylanilytica]|uniref:Lysophospholipase L1-like esterase n=1 Tax=Neolewinella xylanilytica TaxID=1514080 RepID=A0A2S6IAM1_9BACT|nr:GDSL-type esterase/lipase family protein [Neolewinella xylanilytica]PPK88522.1 lysophospholipase L1-like esterase [Neolewinella xylanilytica]
MNLFRSFTGLLLVFFLAGCQPPLAKRNILVIGDSNAAAADGWVFQLQRMRNRGPLVNTALSGNTFGFTDNGNRDRNTLENLTVYLRRGYAEMGGIDEILIGLGTNDCKDQFSDREAEVVTNLEEVLTRIRRFFDERGQDFPRIVLLTPPPVAGNEVVSAEFQGARDCTAALSGTLRTIATREGFCLVDWQERPGDEILVHSEDGIHFNREGYQLLARQVVRSCY